MVKADAILLQALSGSWRGHRVLFSEAITARSYSRQTHSCMLSNIGFSVFDILLTPSDTMGPDLVFFLVLFVLLIFLRPRRLPPLFSLGPCCLHLQPPFTIVLPDLFYPLTSPNICPGGRCSLEEELPGLMISVKIALY
jgi:hypothetical protein